MVREGFLSSEHADLVDENGLNAFFGSVLGQKLIRGTPHIREFKFSLLDEGTQYAQGLQGEKVLLQGVVDCALLEDDGITVLDFKTDHVTERTLDGAAERYRSQVEVYAQALERIYGKRIKATYLYFFRLNRFVKL